MESPERGQLLGYCLREAATRAVELAGGGSSLVFVSRTGAADEGSGPQLRAAAGYDSPDRARQAAAALEAAVRECVAKGRLSNPIPPTDMPDDGIKEVRLLPISIARRIRGVLALRTRQPIPPSAEAALDRMVTGLAMQLDHADLLEEVRRLRADGPEANGAQSGDELLRLSETLFAQDIELLRNNEKLGQLEKIKNDFIEKMSRELRTPLNNIIESTITVLAGENENLSESARVSLRRALDEGTSFQRTLQNILDLWRIKNGEMPVEIQELNFSEIVDEAIFSVQDTLAGREVAIEKRIQQPLPKIKADLAKVNQILFLLLDNAAKFTDEGSIEITADVSDGMLRCQIQDTGIGICPDDQQYIFDEFFQVDAHSSTRYRGAGLGLSLVRDLLILLEGSCSIRSEAGEGTTARFEVPVQIV